MTDADKIMTEALQTVQLIESLRLPKGTRLIGTKEGMEVHRKDGISYVVRSIEPREPR